jgi:hypothetical protein
VEVELALCKFYLLPVGHPPDEVFRGMPASRAETLGDAIQRARPGDHEVGLLEIEQSRIVEVDRITEAPSPQRLSLDRGAQNALVTVGIVLLWGLWVTGAMPGFWLVLVIVTVPLADLLWQATKTAIDRKLAEASTSTVFEPKGSAARGIAWDEVDSKYRTLVPRASVPERQIEASLAVIHGFRDVNDVSKLIDLLQV